MFFAKIKIIIALVLFLGLTANYAMAQMSDKFAKMDKDKNNSVSWEEFEKQYPQMKRLAFDSIDTNKDADLSTDEWKTFEDSHSMNQSNSPKEMKKMKGNMKDKGKPTIFMNAPSE